MVLAQKWPFFELFFSGNIGQENVFYDILERQNAFLGYKDKKLKQSTNWHFSKGVNPQFWSNNGHFSNSFFFVNNGQGNVFYNIVAQKLCLSRLQKQEDQRAKNWHFSKGVNWWLWAKNGSFSNFFFKAI